MNVIAPYANRHAGGQAGGRLNLNGFSFSEKIVLTPAGCPLKAKTSF
jgi:hypothetical protein